MKTWDRDELEKGRDFLTRRIAGEQETLDEIEAEIDRRTSPWPWPKTSRFMARLWAGEVKAAYERPLSIWALNRARPNSGE